MRADQIFSLGILLIGLGIIAISVSTVEVVRRDTDNPSRPDTPETPAGPEAVTSRNEPVYYGVERVVDGDTIIISGFVDSVRLIGIDTPEMGNQFGPRECYALEATNRLKELVEGKEVELKQDVEDRDRYHRYLRYVYLPDGTFVNLLMMKEGYASILTIPPNVRHAATFLLAQQEARQAQRGLWNKAVCPNGNL